MDILICMKARFRHWIKNKKVIVTFYLTILTFFLTIASLHLAILTFFSELWDINSQFARNKVRIAT